MRDVQRLQIVNAQKSRLLSSKAILQLAVYSTDPCVMATRGNSTEFSRHLPIVLFENIIKSNA